MTEGKTIMQDLSAQLAAMPAGQCCPGYTRQECHGRPGSYAETHSFGCPATEGARKTFDDPGSARSRWFGCSEADMAAWRAHDARRDCPCAGTLPLADCLERARSTV